MAEALTQLALVVAALFTGAAVYVNAVEHPARRHLDPRAALQEWQPAYKRGAVMQATLALVGFVLAATAAFLGAGTLVALGAAFIIAPWPWTFLAIMPLNNRLLAMTMDEARLVPTCIRCSTVEHAASCPHVAGRCGHSLLALGIAPVVAPCSAPETTESRIQHEGTKFRRRHEEEHHAGTPAGRPA